MRCSRCGKCCQETEMELSSKDIKRLEEMGYHRREFTVDGQDGVTRLRNVKGWCYFYDAGESKCRIYTNRPLGCCIYPIMYLIDDHTIIIDKLCPMGASVSERELRRKGRILIKLLRVIDSDAEIK